MADELRTLQDLARLASERHDGKRGRALGREAAKHGLTLTYTTVDNILSGKYKSTPKRETVDALAVLASVPKETAYKVAGLPLPQAPFAEQLPPDVDILDAEQRRVLIDMARVLVKQNRQIHDLERAGDGDGKATPNRQAAGSAAPEERSLGESLAGHKTRLRAVAVYPDVDAHAADDTGQTELERLDQEASGRGEEPQ